MTLSHYRRGPVQRSSANGPTDTDGLLAREHVDLGEIFGVLRHRGGLIAAATVACLVATAALVTRQPNKYRAHAVIRVVDARRSMLRGIESSDGDRAPAQSPVLSQSQLLRSRVLVGAVVDSIGMRLQSVTRNAGAEWLTDVRIEPSAVADTFVVHFAADSATVQHGPNSTAVMYGKPYRTAGVSFVIAATPQVGTATLVLLPREETIDQVLEELRAPRREDTDVVDVSYAHRSPVVAQRVVNQLITTFQDANVRAAQGESRRRRLFLEEQLRELSGQLSRAEGALTAFRSREQVFSARDKMQAQQAALMALDIRRGELDADRGMYQSLLSKLSAPGGANRAEELRALMATPELSTNPVVGQVIQQLSQYQTSRDSLTTGEWRAAPTNPDVGRLDQLVTSAERRLVDAVRGHVSTIDARLEVLGTLRARTAAATAAMPRTESVEEHLARQADAHRVLVGRLREEYQKARMAEAIEVGQVEIVDPAALPYRPVGQLRVLKVLLGALIGFGGAAAAVLVADRANARIRRRGELEDDMQVPVLSIIPTIDTGVERRETRAVVKRFLTRASSENRNGRVTRPVPEIVPLSAGAGEAFRLLRSSLGWMRRTETARTVVVSSALLGEGKTTVSANLAAAIGLAGPRALLIDCDLRRSRLHRAFGTPRSPGLTQVLRGLLPPASAIRTTAIDGLFFLPAGSFSSQAADLLGSEQMRRLLADLSERFDTIVLDTPPLLTVADAAALGSLVDGVLLVVRAGQTDRRAVAQSLQHLDRVGARVIGAILNDYRGEAERFGDYYYPYADEDVADYAEAGR